MAWIRITERWDWKPNTGTTIVYHPGSYNVPRAAAKLAVDAGKAVRLRKVNRDDEPVELPEIKTESEGG
jgi:hypothetical protein